MRFAPFHVTPRSENGGNGGDVLPVFLLASFFVTAVAVLLVIATTTQTSYAGEGKVEEPPVPPEFKRTVEVTAQSHRSGELTVQDAFKKLDGSGGIVELGKGTYELDRATTPEDVPIRITGAGPSATTLTGRIALVLSPAPRVEVTDLELNDLYRGVMLTEDGGYGRVKFDGVTFTGIKNKAIRGGVPGPIERITVRNCRFENVKVGVGFRSAESRRMRVSDNEFHDVGERPMVLGAGDGNNRYAEVIGNQIDGVGPGRHPIGILSYVDQTVIGKNTIKNIHNDGKGRHEAISSRGSHTIIRNNTMIDAGGHTAAISLASNGPTTIKNNLIRFTGEHRGKRDGIDCRQTGLTIENNRILGSAIGINLRRGGLSSISGNFIGESNHQKQAIVVSISTGSVVPEKAMRGVTIDNNTIARVNRDEGRFRGIRFNIRNHAGKYDTRMDNVAIIDNVFRDINVAGKSIGIFFGNVNRPDSHMKNVLIKNNDLRAVDVPIHRNRRYVQNLRIADNPGFNTE